MRIIDAFTGRDVRVGEVVPSPGREHDWQLLEVNDRAFFDVRVRIRDVASGREHWSPLTMRYLHPGFLFQRVGFVET